MFRSHLWEGTPSSRKTRRWGGDREWGSTLDWQRMSQDPAFLRPGAAVHPYPQVSKSQIREGACQRRVCSRHAGLMFYLSYVEERGRTEKVSKILKRWP